MTLRPLLHGAPVAGLHDPRAEPQGMRLSDIERLVVIVLAVGSTAWTAAAVATSYTSIPSYWKLALVALLVPLSEMTLFEVRYGKDRFTCTWGEASLLVGFVHVGPTWFVVLAAPGVLLLHLAGRRGWMTSLYNAASFTGSAAAGCAAWEWVARGPAGLGTVRAVAALLLASLVFSVCNSFASCLALAVSQQLALREVWRESAPLSALAWVGNVAVGTAALVLLEDSEVRFAVVPLVVVALLVVRHAFVNAHRERDQWMQLEAAGRTLHRLDEGQLAESALLLVRQLFGIRQAELLLDADARRPPRAYVTTADGRVVRRPGAGSRSSYDGEQAAELVTALSGPAGPLGSLRLIFGGQVRLRAREQVLLAALAEAVVAALADAGRHEELRLLAARHLAPQSVLRSVVPEQPTRVRR